MASSRIDTVFQAGDCELVPMDDVRGRQICRSSTGYLGTVNLNGGTAVAIYSGGAVILAHISPLPTDHERLELTGDGNAALMMKRMRILFDTYHHDFKTKASACVIYPAYQGQIALPDQLRIVSNTLESWGITPVYVSYKVAPSYLRGPAAGTVLIDCREIDKVSIFIEDVRLA